MQLGALLRWVTISLTSLFEMLAEKHLLASFDGSSSKQSAFASKVLIGSDWCDLHLHMLLS